MDFKSLPLVRKRHQHSRKALSSSVLPAGPELDITRPRSGIRHFSQFDSKDEVEEQEKKQKRSVSAFTEPMKWKKLLGKKGGVSPQGDIGQYSNSEKGVQGCQRAMQQQRALQTLSNLQPGQDPRLLRQVPVPGKGYVMISNNTTNLQYPYPQHIPPAAAHTSPPVFAQANPPAPNVPTQTKPTPMTPLRYLLPAPADPSDPALRTPSLNSLEKVAYIASGIAIPIGILFVWVFRFEVLKYGGVASMMVLLWKLGQWQSQISLYLQQNKAKQEDTENPGAIVPQRYFIQQQPQAVPGGW